MEFETLLNAFVGDMPMFSFISNIYSFFRVIWDALLFYYSLLFFYWCFNVTINLHLFEKLLFLFLRIFRNFFISSVLFLCAVFGGEDLTFFEVNSSLDRWYVYQNLSKDFFLSFLLGGVNSRSINDYAKVA